MEDRMNRLLVRLGIPLRAVWLPDSEVKEHAEIVPEEGLIVVYDKDESQALESFFHEILEWRLRPVLSIYREAVNSLIALLEKLAYREKERALAEVLKDFAVWRSLEAERLGSINHKEQSRKSSETSKCRKISDN